jgi:hypothetical protein
MQETTLLLNFDINQTIIFTDKISSMTSLLSITNCSERELGHIVNSLISDVSYGKVINGKWELERESLIEIPPLDEG